MLTPRENALKAYRHEIPEWIPTMFTDMSICQAYPQGERYTGTDHGKDWFGIDWTFVPEIGAPMPTEHNGLFEEMSEWRDYVKFPDLEAIDWEKQAEIDEHTDFLALAAGAGVVPLPNGGSIYDGDKLVICLLLNGMFERMHAFMGMENALCALITDPEECKEFFKAMADYKIAYIKKIAKYYKVDVIEAHDDYGTNDRLFMPPEVFRELIKPELKRIVDACHECGILYQHHSCGHIEEIVGDLVEIGVDAIDTFQGASNPNVKALKEKYGKQVTFCGGFDNMNVLDNPESTKEDIQNEYVRVINDLAPGGNYIIFPVTLTFDFVPAFLEKHYEYGMNFYKNNQQQCG